MSASEGKSPKRTLLLLTLCVLLFVVSDYMSRGAVRGYVRTFAQPVVVVAHQATSTFLRSEFWKSRYALQADVQRLRAEVARGEGMRAALEAVQNENTILRSLARVAESGDGVTVPITSSFSSSPYGTFTVDGGSNLGIHVGDVALAGDGFVLGRVTDVSPHSAIVTAVFSPGAKTEVVVDGGAFAVSGRGAGNARAEVPRELSLTIGSPVVAPSYANRPVGVIGRIESASSSAFSDVFVVFPYNLNAIPFVLVVPHL